VVDSSEARGADGGGVDRGRRGAHSEKPSRCTWTTNLPMPHSEPLLNRQWGVRLPRQKLGRLGIPLRRWRRRGQSTGRRVPPMVGAIVQAALPRMRPISDEHRRVIGRFSTVP